MAFARVSRAWLAALVALALPTLVLPTSVLAEPRLLSQSVRERWTYRDGLPHNVAHRLLASRDGYLWIGTQLGLVRFDGVRFTLFDRASNPGLASNEITALLEDERRVIWVGTQRGLSRLEHERFERVPLEREMLITALLPDDVGGVCVATEANGLYRVTADGRLRPEVLKAPQNPRILTLARVNGELWVGGNGGVGQVRNGLVEPVDMPGLPDSMVLRILSARDGTLWLGTRTGLWRRRAGEVTATRVSELGNATVRALLEDKDGALWVGLESKPLVRLAGGVVQPLPGAAPPADVHELAEDQSGDVWAGSETGGLHRIRWGAVSTFAADEGLSSDVVWAVREGRGGVLWVASEAGLDRVEGGHVTHAHVTELRGASPAALLEDRAGALWVGTGDELLRFDTRGVRRFGKADGLGGTLSRAVLEDRAGTLWVGTSHGLFTGRGDRFTKVAGDPELIEANVLEEGPDGTLWVGTISGLARLEGDRLVRVLVDGVAITSDVAALRAEADGVLWISTAGDGLLRLSHGHLDHWHQRNGLFEETVLAILDDGAGQLWLSGNRGITRVARDELLAVAEGRRAAVAPTLLGTADGMRERECNGGVSPSAWRASDGRLWFATIGGAVAVDPTRVITKASPPPARVEEVVADGRALPLDGAPLRLPAGVRRVEVRYTGLALAAADRVRFRYRLVGLDDAFLEVGGERVTQFTHLDPGEYRFEVATAIASGEWGQPAVITLTVAPFFWQTGWFAGAVLALVVALVTGVMAVRTAALRRREALLTARVEEEMRKVKVLTGLLPTCAWCKKSRDEGGRWRQFEAYVSAHTDAKFSHGICPECAAQYVQSADDGSGQV